MVAEDSSKMRLATAAVGLRCKPPSPPDPYFNTRQDNKHDHQRRLV